MHRHPSTDDEGGTLRYSNWRRRIWEPATAAARCAGAGFHDLRRLNATTLVVEGVDVKTAQTASAMPTASASATDDNGSSASS